MAGAPGGAAAQVNFINTSRRAAQAVPPAASRSSRRVL